MELEKSYGHSDTLTFQDRLLAGLYGHTAGRVMLRLLVSPAFSRLGGYLLDTRLSALAVRPFVRANHIDLTDCQKQSFSSYNDFFTRKLRPEARPVCNEELAWVSPCDARLSVYPIYENGHFLIKHTRYTLKSLLKNQRLADRYLGGTLWLYRLCVDDYHRYIYPADGVKSANVQIPGVFHTVNPAANEYYPIYKENTREYCLIRTKTCGTVLMMEVGAMLVGKIENRHPGTKNVHLGQEKGNFAFGGSTIILLTQAGCVVPDAQIAENTAQGLETRVRAGQKTGKILQKNQNITY